MSALSEKRNFINWETIHLTLSFLHRRFNRLRTTSVFHDMLILLFSNDSQDFSHGRLRLYQPEYCNLLGKIGRK